MRGIRLLLVAAVVASCFTATVPQAKAQVTVEVGAAPECPYGYFDVQPYDCAPAGYYGPEWFTGDVFIGAGPWFHGRSEFRGKVDNSFDPQRGYKGAKPSRGEKAEPAKRVDSTRFKGNEERDGRGHTTSGKTEGRPEEKH